MAIFNAADLGIKPRHMGGYGNAVVVWGSVSPTAGASGDIYRPLIIPGGLEVTDVEIVADDLDSGATPALAVKVGFTPLNPTDGPIEDDDYFAAAGSAALQAAGRTSLSFHPIKFERPVILIITLTAAAATFAAGKVSVIVKGDGLGIK